jgi:uncharacterized protein (TIGR01777 family)
MSESIVILTGGTGFIGRALCQGLTRGGYQVAVLTRNLDRCKAIFGDQALAVQWDGRTAAGWQGLASRAEAVINLAGQSIGRGRWTRSMKSQIQESRILAGRAVVEGLRLASPRPKTLVQASAVGYYGPRDDEELDESSPPGDGFLAETVRLWEESTREAEELGVRRVILRSGLVLEKDGGVLPRFLMPFRLYLGGPLGSGEQWISWVHRDDEVEAIRYVLRRPDLAGVFNLVTPGPVRMREFARILGREMRRPSWFPVPSFLLRWIFGEMAEETILSGQKVLPKAFLREDYQFLYPDLATALRRILKGSS